VSCKTGFGELRCEGKTGDEMLTTVITRAGILCMNMVGELSLLDVSRALGTSAENST